LFDRLGTIRQSLKEINQDVIIDEELLFGVLLFRQSSLKVAQGIGRRALPGFRGKVSSLKALRRIE